MQFPDERQRSSAPLASRVGVGVGVGRPARLLLLLLPFALLATIFLALSTQRSWELAQEVAADDLEHLAQANAARSALALRNSRRLVEAVDAELPLLGAQGGDPMRLLTRELRMRFSGDERVDLIDPSGARILASSLNDDFDPALLAEQRLRVAALPLPAVGWAYRRGEAWWLPMLHRADDGHWLLISLPVASLLADWQAPRHPRAGTVALQGPDGRMLLRLPFQPVVTGHKSVGSALALRMAQGQVQGASTGQLRIEAAEFGPGEHLIGWAAVPGSSLRAVATTGLDVVWQRWLLQSGYLAAALMALLMLIVGGSALTIHRLGAAIRSERQARREQDRARELARQALDASRDTTWQLLADGQLVFDTALDPLLGGPREATVDERSTLDGLLRRVEEADRARVRSSVQATRDSRVALYVEFTAVGLDQQVRHYVLKGAAFQGEPGEGVVAVGTLRDVSRLVRAQGDLLDLAATLKSMCAYALIGPWTVDLATGHLRLSEEARRIYGLEPGTQAPDWLSFRATYGEHQEKLSVARLRLVREGIGYDHVIPIVEPDGTERWLRSVATGRFVDGRLVRVDGAIQDVSGLVRTQDELRATHRRERWLAAAVEGSTSLILVTDEAERITWCNRAFTRRTGYALADIRGQRPGPLLQRDDVSLEAKSRMRRALDAREGFSAVRLINYTRSGDRYWVDVEVQPIVDAAGRLEGFVGVQTDVTRDIEREEALREVMRRFDDATHGAHIGVWERRYADDDSRWNDVMYELTGLGEPGQPVSTANFVHALHPDDFARLRVAYEQAILDPDRPRWQAEFRIRSGHGWRWIRSLASFERDERGQAIRAVGTMVDVTAERLLQQEQTARAAAEARAEAKSTFVSRMSHELRTPLNAIIGNAQLLAAVAGLQDVSAARVQRIERAGWHLLDLIDDVLDLSRLEAGALRSDAVPIRLDAVFEDVISFVTPLCERLGTVLDVPATEVRVLADPTRLRQVVTNLMSNGIKYGRPGGRVALRVSPESAGVAIEVEDDGLGMSSAQLERLFQPFERLGREATTIEGTGIGLTITRALVEQMGGRIEVRSAEGQGTCVRIELPAAAEGDGEDCGLPLAGEADGLRLQVLCVDDNEVNSLVFVEALGLLRPHWTCQVVQSLDQARSSLERGDVDLLFLDYHLSDGSGLSLLGEQTLADAPPESARRWRERVVLLTADSSEEMQQAAEAAGVRHWLGKPFRLRDLDRLLRRIQPPAIPALRAPDLPVPAPGQRH